MLGGTAKTIVHEDDVDDYMQEPISSPACNLNAIHKLVQDHAKMEEQYWGNEVTFGSDAFSVLDNLVLNTESHFLKECNFFEVKGKGDHIPVRAHLFFHRSYCELEFLGARFHHTEEISTAEYDEIIAFLKDDHTLAMVDGSARVPSTVMYAEIDILYCRQLIKKVFPVFAHVQQLVKLRKRSIADEWPVRANKESKMKKYASRKIVDAEPMTSDEYMVWRETTAKKHSDATLEEGLSGYHVVYNIDTPEEYHSWSPKQQFENGHEVYHHWE